MVRVRRERELRERELRERELRERTMHLIVATELFEKRNGGGRGLQSTGCSSSIVGSGSTVAERLDLEAGTLTWVALRSASHVASSAIELLEGGRDKW